MSRRLTIIHLSDPHFGTSHRFNPPKGPDGAVPIEEGRQTMLGSLRNDWAKHEAESHTILVITGDLTCAATEDEYRTATDFVTQVQEEKVFGRKLSRADIFVVPGNHDVHWDANTASARLERYAAWYQNFREEPVFTKDPHTLNRVHNRSRESGLVVVELNSSAYVRKNSEDSARGRIDERSLAHVDQALSKIPEGDLSQSLRVALVHHHPILIPAFAESGRGYDAILGGRELLELLTKYGFRLLLHGHKVCLMNETSASDGDIFPHRFRKSGLGPLIGKRSWGGVVGISSRGPLLDGGTVYVPLRATNDTDGEYIIEGHGVDPDIIVDNDPQSVIDGRDPQLERGVEEALRMMADNPMKLPKRPADPVKTD